MRICIIILSLLIIAPTQVEAQLDVLRDSTLVVPDSLAGSGNPNRWGVFSIFTGKPGKAALYGLLIPSGGQFYNKRYWKVPIVLAAEGALLYFAIDRTRFWNEINNAYIQMLANPGFEYRGVTDPNIILPVRNNVRQEKDYLWLGFGLVHFLAITEAFVDAHLLDFDIDDDLSFHISPNIQQAGITFATITIPLNKNKKKPSPKFIF